MQRNYRGQRVDTKEWVQGYHTEDPDLGLCYIQGWEYWSSPDGLQRAPYIFEVIPETVGQSTGLLDKNGKEIYEYDACEVTRPCIWVTGFIKFHQGCFIFQEHKTGNIIRLCDLELNGYKIKVTGTAVDNPELLQEVER